MRCVCVRLLWYCNALCIYGSVSMNELVFSITGVQRHSITIAYSSGDFLMLRSICSMCMFTLSSVFSISSSCQSQCISIWTRTVQHLVTLPYTTGKVDSTHIGLSLSTICASPAAHHIRDDRHGSHTQTEIHSLKVSGFPLIIRPNSLKFPFFGRTDNDTSHTLCTHSLHVASHFTKISQHFSAVCMSCCRGQTLDGRCNKVVRL